MDQSGPGADMTRMTSPEVAAALEQGFTTAIVVLGAQEQHGDHLPLATDSMWGEHLAGLLATRLGDALIAPVVPVGFSPEHMRFAGTISLRQETLTAILEDYLTSLEQHGFRRVVVLPSHGGNFAPLVDALPLLRQRHPALRIVAYTDLIGLVDAAAEVAASLDVTPNEAGAHAGEWETSLVLASSPTPFTSSVAKPATWGHWRRCSIRSIATAWNRSPRTGCSVTRQSQPPRTGEPTSSG